MENLSIYLKNGYVVHVKPELNPMFEFFGDSIICITDRTIVFDVGEVATIQIKQGV